jgi:hypothetical protein
MPTGQPARVPTDLGGARNGQDLPHVSTSSASV